MDFLSGSESEIWNLSESSTCLITDAVLYCMSLLNEEVSQILFFYVVEIQLFQVTCFSSGLY